MFRLDDRIALVIGAGSVGPGWGNGKAAAVAYARAGAKVACIDVNLQAAEETAGIITSEGGSALALACDVTNPDAVSAMVIAVEKHFGRIDILHNNVGHTTMGGPPDLSEEAWARALELNLTYMFRTTKAVLPGMIARGRGVITNISSVASLRYTGYPYASYYAAKGGVNQFTIGLALQYARQGIRTNAIAPGMMDTPLIHSQISGQYASVEAMMAARHEASPTGRMGTGWDIANAAVFLASDGAAYINGVILPVDGGLTARCA